VKGGVLSEKYFRYARGADPIVRSDEHDEM
jgi:hypothetical protein